MNEATARVGYLLRFTFGEGEMGKDSRKKLYYLFDFADHWTFEIRKARGAKKPEAGVKYPRVVEALEPAPEQYPRWENS